MWLKVRSFSESLFSKTDCCVVEGFIFISEPPNHAVISIYECVVEAEGLTQK